MGKETGISWTHHTFNPWWGCTKLSPACDNCYAEAWDRKFGGDHWGAGKPRKFFTDKHWNEPLKWNTAAKKDGVRRRVFCASMADVFDTEVPDEWRLRLFNLIGRTPDLDWLLLTKRPKVMYDHMERKSTTASYNAGRTGTLGLEPIKIEEPLPNVWCGTTVENQQMADARLRNLALTKAKIRFLSMEPLLGPVDISPFINNIDWVIVGGESGTAAREWDIDWAHDIKKQCDDAGVKFFFKQLGAKPIGISVRSKKGQDPAEWPANLNVQEFPIAA